jgi:ankyrin repeat protein
VPKQFVYESLSDYLKPKSKEEIRKSIDNLASKRKLLIGAEHGILWLVQEALAGDAIPDVYFNLAFQLAVRQNYNNITKLLLKDMRVRNSLSKKDLDYYDYMISTMKEGFSDYLKPKSEEEIKKELSKLETHEIISYLATMINNNEPIIKEFLTSNIVLDALVIWDRFFILVDLIKRNHMTKSQINYVLISACKNGNFDILKYILDNTDIKPNLNHLMKMTFSHLDKGKLRSGYFKILKYLFNKEEVRNSLTIEEFQSIKKIIDDYV